MTHPDAWRDILVCPRCRARLEERMPDALSCTGCPATYPIRFGIADLRLHGDPYLSVEDDVAAAARLSERAAGSTFEQVLASYYAENPKVSEAQAALFTRGVVAAAGRAETVLATWSAMSTARSSGRLLDLGCGTAPLTIAAARRGFAAVGVDAGLRWLVLARARAAEAGLELPFVCANAEALPFGEGSFDVVAGESIVENVSDQDRTLAEAFRVTRPTGALWLSVPNKHSIGPDPHTGILAGGWLPEKVTAALVARRGDVPPRRRLLGGGALRALVRRAGFTDVALTLPDIAGAQRAGASPPMRLAIDAYHLAKRTPVVGALVAAIAPTLLLVASRGSGGHPA